jgi:hypothetical protein
MLMAESRHSGVVASFGRVRLIARQTLGEAMHLRVTLLLGLIAAGLIAGSRWIEQFNFGATDLKFIGDFGLGAMGLFGTLLAALVTAQLFFREIDSRSIYWVLSRPVRRWEYLGGKFVGVCGVLALFTAGLGLVLGVLLSWRAAQLRVDAFALEVFLAACGLQWLKITLVAAMTLLVCSYAGSALFASVVGLVFAAVGDWQDFTGANVRWLRVWPDLSLFNAEDFLGSGRAVTSRWLASLAAYWIATVALCGGVATYVFKQREL